jgi:hypothetical protein
MKSASFQPIAEEGGRANRRKAKFQGFKVSEFQGFKVKTGVRSSFETLKP